MKKGLKLIMELHGKNIVGGKLSALGEPKIFGFDPKAGKQLDPPFYEAIDDEVDYALNLAAEAFLILRKTAPETLASFLRTIADEITSLGDELIERASLESGLGRDRLTGERARTVNQLRMFADLVQEGSFVDARIDTALPDRKPLPRPDLRRLLIPVGPVVVFSASNFPLAFSVAGGDTASAFAAGNPVIVKAHPAHPATSELVAGAITRAVEKCELPPGTFSLLHAAEPSTSIALVQHPGTKAVGFTGSERAGLALYQAGAQRPDPIPVFVEMGSINPVFVLPGVLANSGETIAQGLFGSINLGVGQFCTNPGVVVGIQDDSFQSFREKLVSSFSEAAPGSMLYPKILKGYEGAVKTAEQVKGVQSTRTSQTAVAERTEAAPVLLEATSETWLANEELSSEMFGPASILVSCGSENKLLEMAKALPGTLTATIHGTPQDLEQHRELIAILETKAGRLLFNGFPTGVEVSPAMHHGGPFPATADAKFTSVGTAAILRFLRPVCYQNFPETVLPAELKDDNPRHIWRTVNGKLTQQPLSALQEGA